jgi:hypothetical protein
MNCGASFAADFRLAAGSAEETRCGNYSFADTEEQRACGQAKP